jgi:hypothetical protein
MKETKEIVPKWLLKENRVTLRQWKALKRRELHAIKRALDEYRGGCYYTPLSNIEVDKIQESIDRIEKSQTVKNWGR